MPLKDRASKRVGTSFMAALTLVLLSTTVLAQKNEFGVSVGYMFTGDRTLDPPSSADVKIDNKVTYEISYGRRMVDAAVASAHLEFLLVGSPSKNVKASNLLLPSNYSSLFLTPGFKLKIFPGSPLTPYLAVGAGYARFNQSDVLINGQPNRGDRATNTLVYNYGGGFELKIFPFVSLRGEIRDFVTGNPGLNFPISGGKQHNVIPAVGAVLRF